MVPVKCIRHIMSCVRPEKGSCSFYSKKSDSTEYNIIPCASHYSNHTSRDKARILTDYFLHSISIEYPVITVTTVCVFTFAVNDIGICFMLNLFADALIYKLALVYTSAELLVSTSNSYIMNHTRVHGYQVVEPQLHYCVWCSGYGVICVDFNSSTVFWIGIWTLREIKEIHYLKIRNTSGKNVKKCLVVSNCTQFL